MTQEIKKIRNVHLEIMVRNIFICVEEVMVFDEVCHSVQRVRKSAVRWFEINMIGVLHGGFTTCDLHPKGFHRPKALKWGVLDSMNVGCFVPSRYECFNCHAMRKAIKASINVHTIQQIQHTPGWYPS